MDSSLTFSDQEIQEELSRLGYNNIPQEKLKEFQRDLNRLVEAEKLKADSDDSFGEASRFTAGTRRDADNGGLQRLGTDQGKDQECFELRREDLERHDLRQAELRGQPTVPGHFALYELPRSNIQTTRDDLVSETDSEIRRMKRKTLRKNDEGAKFIDESMSDIDVESLIDTQEQMRRMVLRDIGVNNNADSRRSQSARFNREGPPPYRLSPDDPRPPSVIYPMMDHPHTKNLQRADPVARFHQLQQCWSVQQAPGENPRKGLRWNVREHMLTQFVPEKKPQRKYVPNNYVPPPDKKRQQLRWQIRTDMAQGNMPV